jgi:enoyl-CoA hydratase
MIATQNFSEYVRIESNENIGVATIVLERPERRNAVDRAVAQALSDAFSRFEAEPEWRFQQKTTTA